MCVCVCVCDLSANNLSVTFFKRLVKVYFFCSQRNFFQVLLFNIRNFIYQIFVSNTNNLRRAV